MKIIGGIAISYFKLSLPAANIFSSGKVRRTQPEKLIVECKHLSIFSSSIRKQHSTTIAAMLQGVLITGLKWIGWRIGTHSAYRFRFWWMFGFWLRTFLRTASAGRLFAGTRLTLLRTTLRTIFAYLRTAIAYPIKLFSPLPDSPFSNAVFIAYITETKDSGPVCRFDGLPVRFCHNTYLTLTLSKPLNEELL